MRGFYFSTENNRYFYDDENGNVEERVEDKKTEDIINVSKYNTEIRQQFITAEDVKDQLSKTISTQLTLVVTENCNLRCKYCVYSGNYENSRVHSKNKMSIEVAQKALLQYFQFVKKYEYQNVGFIPYIGFFGGEPLMNYEVIQFTIDWVKQNYGKEASYYITTNAILLDEKSIQFLVDNNFWLTISLNGDKSENDRMRVFNDGSGSFEIIMEKLKYLYKKYPNYLKNNVSFAITYDTGTDMLRLREFFTTNKYVKDGRKTLNSVIDYFTDWYDQYNEHEKERHSYQMQSLRDNFDYNLKAGSPLDSVSTKLFYIYIFNILNRVVNVSTKKSKNLLIPYTGTCFPGSKVAVDYKGDLFLCEKVNNKNSLGNVDTWFDYSKIASLLNEYNNKMEERCRDCPVQRLCTICFKDVMDGSGKCQSPAESWCEDFIQAQRKSFAKVYGLLEKGKTVEEIEKLIL